MTRKMDEWDREWLTEFLEISDAETEDILNRTLKILDEKYDIITDTQEIADTIEAFEQAKADAWKETNI